jgi:phage terminase small subunit
MSSNAPAHLSPGSRKWWRRCTRIWALEDHHRLLLTGAAEAWDRAQEARVQIEISGGYYRDRFGQPHVHPAVKVEAAALTTFARLLRELGLDENQVPAAGKRPPPPLGRYR